MYLREVFMKNNGPIKDLHLEFSFDSEDQPIPHIMVGKNGSGKTNLLSVIADSLMQGASKSFSDVLTHQEGGGQSYFRIVGGSLITFGEKYGLSVLRFSDEEGQYFYHENFGVVEKQDLDALLPESLQAGITWGGSDSSKEIEIDREKATKVYQSGVYAFFPTSRSEDPHWFNTGSIHPDEFDIAPKFSNNLGRKMYVERGINTFAQWLLGVITDSRMNVLGAEYTGEDKSEQTPQVMVQMDFEPFIESQKPLIWSDYLLKSILDDESARFVWTGHRDARKVAISTGPDGRILRGLTSLSGGQATMLAAFGTILRYADEMGQGPGQVEGVVVIDELDAHMHIDLQLRALPKMIKYFPKYNLSSLATHLFSY